MTTPQISFLSEILSEKLIPAGKLAYFRARLTNELHALVLAEFAALSEQGKMSKAKLAQRIGRKPEQVTRWLAGPGNWTIETVSDLLLGMGCEPSVSLSRLEDTVANAANNVHRLVIPAQPGAAPPSSITANAKDTNEARFKYG